MPNHKPGKLEVAVMEFKAAVHFFTLSCLRHARASQASKPSRQSSARGGFITPNERKALRTMPPANPEEQYGPEIDAIITDLERKHLEKVKVVQDENDRLKKEIETVDSRIDAAESKGWAGAVAAFKRKINGGG